LLLLFFVDGFYFFFYFHIISSNFICFCHRFLGDEHGRVEFPKNDGGGSAGAAAAATGALDVADEPLPGHGDVVSFVVPHCDPTVNLYDFYHVIGGGDQDSQTLVDIWPIQGRGRGF
jgi:D-serine deaminase-like pyridoxal phosphate-dependent protein